MIRLLAFTALLVSTGAHAFTINLDFDNTSVDDRCDGIGQGRSYVSSEESASSSNSCKFWIKKGQTGWGTWGGTIQLPKQLRDGDELWLRLRVLMPETFDYIAPGEGERLKFVRVRTRKENGDSIGYNDIYFNRLSARSPYGFIYDEQRWRMFGTAEDTPVKGHWETYELYLRFATNKGSVGGDALVRFWKNGVLLLESRERQTLKFSDAYASAVYLGTYWNGGSPKTQHMFVDDVTLTSDRPSSQDDYGNPFIGMDALDPGFCSEET